MTTNTIDRKPMLRITLTALAMFGIASCSTSAIQSETTDWKIQELALMAQTRCLVTGGHMSRNEAAKFLAQVNKDQSGQFQRVYDSVFEGVSNDSNRKVESLIKEAGGCREMISGFIYSEPETPFKKSLQLDLMLKPIQYPDDK